MASPLILRITSKFDSSGIKDAKVGFTDLTSTVRATNASVRGVSGSFEEMTAALAGVKIVGTKSLPSLVQGFSVFRGAIRGVISTLRLFRGVALVGGIIAAPLINSAKRAIELDTALKPLISRLEQLGQSGLSEGRRLSKFAEQFSKSTNVSASEVVKSLDILITKTRTAANAEQIITTAQKLHLATGAKLVDVTTALANAYTGDASALSALTGKTKLQINSLLASGDLVRQLDADFSAAADRGANSFLERVKSIPREIGNIGTKLEEIAGKTVPIKILLDLGTQILGATKKINELQTSLDRVLFNKKTPDLRTFEGLTIAAGEAAAAVREAQAALEDKTGVISPKTRAAAEAFLKTAKQQAKATEDQVNRERQLASSVRERLTTITALTNLQTALLREQERPQARGETSEAFNKEKRDIQQRIQLQKEEQIVLDGLAERRKILSEDREVTAEEEANIQARVTQRLVQSRVEAADIDEAQTSREIAGITRLKEAQLSLDKFQAEKQRGKFANSDEEDIIRFKETALRREVELITARAKAEISTGQHTAEEVAAILLETDLKIDSKRQALAEERATREVELAQKTAKGRLTEEQKTTIFKKALEDFSGPGKLDAQLDLKFDVDKMLQQARANLDTSKEVSAFKDRASELLSPELKSLKSALEVFKESSKQERIDLNVRLLQDRAQQQELATSLAELISTTVISTLRRKLSPFALAQELVTGAAPGGSET